MEPHALAGECPEFARALGVARARLDVVATSAQLSDKLETDPAIRTGDDDSHDLNMAQIVALARPG
ncbi:hypothetical protein [Nannocystis pusilla]|uniref:hypothetical protein n=1 Tax=Nannocystis pusilla TaxID=889268 RepID=UPI003BF072D2